MRKLVSQIPRIVIGMPGQSLYHAAPFLAFTDSSPFDIIIYMRTEMPYVRASHFDVLLTSSLRDTTT